MIEESDEWENMYLGAGSPDNILLVGFKNPELKNYTGMSLGEVAAERGTPPEETAMDLIVEDGSRITCVYFSQSEEVLAKAVALPWVSFCSDEGAPAAEGVFLKKNNHPRAYGSFARVLAKYVRDEKVLPLEEAIRKLTGLPAANLKLDRRGLLREGLLCRCRGLRPGYDPGPRHVHRSPTSTPPEWFTSLSTVNRSSRTASTPARSPGGWCVGRGGGGRSSSAPGTRWEGMPGTQLCSRRTKLEPGTHSGFCGRYAKVASLLSLSPRILAWFRRVSASSRRWCFAPNG